jgi:S-adenosylmethionine/arginine decarboxylase-like enzyme
MQFGAGAVSGSAATCGAKLSPDEAREMLLANLNGEGCSCAC